MGVPSLPSRPLPSATSCRPWSAGVETWPRGQGGWIYLQGFQDVIVRDLGGQGLESYGVEGGLDDLVS